MPAIALTSGAPILIGSANDFGFDGIFARQVQALGRPGDVLAGIGASGNSANVLRAFEYAREHGLRTIALAGRGGKLPELSDVAIQVPAEAAHYTQDSHIVIRHTLCDPLESSL